MKAIKDNFSGQAATYAQFRPVYPDALYRWLYEQVQSAGTAWDVASGNGQVAARLAEKFAIVHATDISTKQLEHAIKKDNIMYSEGRAEQSGFADNSFDLITVAQALHWFDFGLFNKEVQRTGKEGAIIAIWAYSLLRIAPELDSLLDDFYFDRVGPYWDPERRYVDEGYASVPFPFTPIEAPAFTITARWSLSQLAGYLNSWSSVQHFIKARGHNPVTGFMQEIKEVWGDASERTVHFPLAVKVGRITKTGNK